MVLFPAVPFPVVLFPVVLFPVVLFPVVLFPKQVASIQDHLFPEQVVLQQVKQVVPYQHPLLVTVRK